MQAESRTCKATLQLRTLQFPILTRATCPVDRCRSLLLGGDFFLGGVVAATLAKLVLRLRALGSLPAGLLNRTAAEAMLVSIVDYVRMY